MLNYPVKTNNNWYAILPPEVYERRDAKAKAKLSEGRRKKRGWRERGRVNLPTRGVYVEVFFVHPQPPSSKF